MSNQRTERLLTDALQRLAAQWHMETDYMHETRRELRVLLNEVGETRFVQTIENTIRNYASEFRPPISIIRQNVPQRQEDFDNWFKTTAEMIRDRAAHPEEYFGEADIIAIWREQEKRYKARRPFLTHKEADEVIREARAKAGVK